MMATFAQTVLSTILMAAIQFSSAQNSYDAILEDVVIPTYSKEYLLEPDFYFDEANGLFGNMTIIKKFPADTQVRFIIKRASMGEYVIDIGIDERGNFCEALEETIIVGPFFKAIGFKSDSCPPDVGVYRCEDYHTPMDQLPQIFISNNYKVICEIYSEEQKILVMHTFAKIV